MMPLIKIVLIVLCWLSTTIYAADQQTYYRNFWNPTYHGRLLNYCIPAQKECGMPVANRYCELMGYDHASKIIVANNVGLTNYFGTCNGCKGWNCKGFSEIVCVAKTLHKPARDYYFRLKKFVVPRFNHERVDWCYQDSQGCGKRAASSFCRRMGFLRAQSFKKESHVTATRSLGNQKLCFGEHCQAFSSITCYR